MEFSRQEYWSGLPFSSPGDLTNSGIKPGLLHCWQVLYHCATWCSYKQKLEIIYILIYLSREFSHVYKETYINMSFTHNVTQQNHLCQELGSGRETKRVIICYKVGLRNNCYERNNKQKYNYFDRNIKRNWKMEHIPMSWRNLVDYIFNYTTRNISLLIIVLDAEATTRWNCWKFLSKSCLGKRSWDGNGGKGEEEGGKQLYHKQVLL